MCGDCRGGALYLLIEAMGRNTKCEVQETVIDYSEVSRELSERGWSVIRNLLDTSQIQLLKESFDYMLENIRPPSEILYTHSDKPVDSPGMSNLMTQWFNFHKSDSLSSTKSLAHSFRSIATEIMGATPVLFQDILMIKKSGYKPFEWHQDYPYWPVDSPRGLLFWVPAQDVNAENGGLGFADNSHTLGIGPSINLHTGRPQSGMTGEMPANLHQITPELTTGDVLVFTPLTWHRSGVNQTKIPRMAWSCSWLHPESHWDIERAPNHPMAKYIHNGERVTGVFTCD